MSNATNAGMALLNPKIIKRGKQKNNTKILKEI
jgi:hypothetical protein